MGGGPGLLEFEEALSAVEHESDTDVRRVQLVVSAAVMSIAGVDAERFKMYSDLLVKSLS